MKNISGIFMMLIFFIYIIACSILYLIYRDMRIKIIDKKAEKLRSTFGKEVLKQLNSLKLNNSISTLDINYVKGKLKKRQYVRVFNESITIFNKDTENHIITKKYMSNFEEFIHTTVKYVRLRDNISKGYISMYLGEYRIDNFEVNEFLLNNLKSKNLDLRTISLRALSKIGNVNNLVEGIKYLSSQDKYINNKVLKDILSQFYGDRDLLSDKLLDVFNELNIEIQKSIIEDLSHDRIESAKEKLLELLKNEKTHKEVKISIIRYFVRVKYQDAKSEIINIIETQDWDFRAISATALKNYNDEESINTLLKSISDTNWHVRYNSALSLLSFNDDNIIDKVLEKDDKYSKDILNYVMNTNQKNRKAKVQNLC